MKFNFRILALIAVGIGSASAYSQIIPTAYSGTTKYVSDDSDYTGDALDFGDRIQHRVGNGNGSSASSTFQPKPVVNGGWGRKMIRYSASGIGDFMLPSDRQGNMSAAVAGEKRVLNTWNPEWNANSHLFSTSVQETDPDEVGAVEIEVQDSPIPFVSASSGSFLIDMLDGSSYDQNPVAGEIELNRGLTPIISLNYTVPEYTFTRGVVTWSDGSTTPSMNVDRASSGMWFLLNPVGGGPLIITGTPFGPSADWAIGEGESSRVLSSFNGVVDIDISAVPFGLYDGLGWSIPWNLDSYDSTITGSAGGYVEQEIIQRRINIVPEPATVIAFGAGLVALLARRRRKS